MRHPPALGAVTLTLVLLLTGPPLLAPAAYASTADSLGPFHARMLEEHGGVYVEEELAGLLDRDELARDLRDQVHAHGAPVNVLVISSPMRNVHLDDVAEGAARELDQAVLVFTPDHNDVGSAQLALADLPRAAVEYTFYTGAYPEVPGEQLARLLRAAEYTDLEERTRVAEVEYAQTVGARPPDSNEASPGFPSQRWQAVTWRSTAGLVTGAVVAWALVGLARALWLRLRSASEGARV